MRAKWAGVAAFAAIMGCATALEQASHGPPADLTDAARVVDWANIASPTVVSYLAVEPLVMLDVLGSSCPRVHIEGDTTVLQGDCVSASGTAWSGSARIEGYDPETSAGLYSFDGFGSDVLLTGTARFESTEPGGYNFWADISREPLDFRDPHMAIVYQGTTWQVDSDDLSEGAGSLWVDGWGRVDAQTVGHRKNAATCSDEALSGSTVLTAGLHEVVIDYDGERDCDPRSTVRWSLDGQPQGELEGVSCSTLGPGAGVWALLPLLAIRRRNQRPS